MAQAWKTEIVIIISASLVGTLGFGIIIGQMMVANSNLDTDILDYYKSFIEGVNSDGLERLVSMIKAENLKKYLQYRKCLCYLEL